MICFALQAEAVSSEREGPQSVRRHVCAWIGPLYFGASLRLQRCENGPMVLQGAFRLHWLVELLKHDLSECVMKTARPE